MTDQRCEQSNTTWDVYDRQRGANDAWDFKDRETTESPDTAARVVAAKYWTRGAHNLLVVGPKGAYEYHVTVESDGPLV